MRYLDPRADLTFKKVFGEHKDIVISFLNAMLPIGDDEQIEEIEYQSVELTPERPTNKNSIVDVNCIDKNGRQFLVEMQFAWSGEFYSRVVFNASKAYVRQADKGYLYKDLKPVYSLNLINTKIEPNLEGYYHHYRIVHSEHSDRVIDGLQFIFVELQKFNPSAYNEKKMQVLWLRFLTEIGERTRVVPDELRSVPELDKAIRIIEESALTDSELHAYDKFWDSISYERTLFDDGETKGRAEGHAEGRAEGRAEGIEVGIEKGRVEGIEEGKLEATKNIAKTLKNSGLSFDIISKSTGLSIEEIENI